MDWQPISTAPKDGTRVIGWCDHEADPYFDEENHCLTIYGAHSESCGSYAENGVQILVWGGETYEGDRVAIPDWWFVDDNDNWNYPANPTHWQPLPEPPAPTCPSESD